MMYLVRDTAAYIGSWERGHKTPKTMWHGEVMQYWLNASKSPKQNMLFFLLIIERLGKYWCKTAARWNSGLPACLLACTHRGLYTQCVHTLTLLRDGFISMELTKCIRMCYICNLEQTPERNCGKEGWAWTLGVQDMPSQILPFVH